MQTTKRKLLRVGLFITVIGALSWYSAVKSNLLEASSHREAPLISNDPLADNTDLYAFRSPDDTNTVTILANYIPFELPMGGPNYASFGEHVRYEIHVKKRSSIFIYLTKSKTISYIITNS